ncbi:uncharacterized protein LOC131666188 isoform X2 [Phymastichus coffea]|uniref:uncharacterized protein LOC131666188 isoform X2 n=1 Tax=Phymastichus coffea TaxID=108790 RepID=UPI00273C0EE5|nr:uncharacterized protein LOC131666188 isoform X2 [Phymastichus coffea]
MVTLKNSNNRCRFCSKVFCCLKCRDAHESNKHADLNSSKPKCPLCFKCDLPYDPRLNSIDDNLGRAQFVCHVVINHLPLRCKVCGDTFDSNQAFQSAEPCKGPIKKVAAPVVTASPVSNLPCDNNNNSDIIPVEKKLLLTPQYHIEVNASEKSLASAGSLHLKNPENFDSPLELARHTSTPMHLSVVGLQKYHGHPPSVPEFDLKTPSSQRTFDTIGSSWGSAASVFESRYFTAETDGPSLGSAIEGSNNSTNARDNQNIPTWTSPVFPILKKQLEAQNSDADSPSTGSNYRVERSILKSALLSRIDDSHGTPRDSIEKRVRFSDQFDTPTSTITTMSDASACDSDIFFEARESLDDDEQAAKDSPVIKQLEQNKVERVAADTSVSNSKINASATSSSSRVLMMLLVEKTDNAKGFSSVDLAPLIDSGLKKLEESANLNNNSRTDNGNQGSSNSGTVAKLTTEITSYARQIDGSMSKPLKGCRRRASIKDTLITMSDCIECITPPSRCNQQTVMDQEREWINKADSVVNAGGAYKSDGLFSAMARVVRSALKKLPAAVTARNLSREPIPLNPNSPPTVAPTAVVDCHATATDAIALVHRSSSIKRPRDRIDSLDEAATLRDSPGRNSGVSSSISSSTRANITTIQNTASMNSELTVTSPAAKRHRGWCRIRAREPIARMREQVVAASLRGSSRETQRFQQGELSIGDTFLPLPSRAHQSTQTED